MVENLSVVGPYSPISGPDSISHCGTLIAIQRLCGIDTGVMLEGNIGKVYEATGKDGHVWFTRSIGGFLWFAFRDRTPEELAELRDWEADSRFSSWFSSERLRYCREIGSRVRWLVDELRPERCQSRQARREFKRQLKSLIEVQCDVMGNRFATLAEIRARLAPFGLPRKLWNQ